MDAPCCYALIRRFEAARRILYAAPRPRASTASGGEPLPAMEKRFAHPSRLLRRLHLDPEDVDSDVSVVDVDQADLCVVVATATLVVAALAAAGGYEVEFLVAQFNRVGKFMHVTLLLYSLGVMAPLLTATTIL
jgi:hypothetical protein